MQKTVEWEFLEHFHNHIAPQACAVFNETGNLPPQMYAVGVDAENRMCVLVVPPDLVGTLFSSPEAKDAQMGFVKSLLNQDGAEHKHIRETEGVAIDAVFALSEAWIVEKSVPKGAAIPQNIIPSESPDRKEVLLVMVHTEHYSFSVSHPVSADKNRQATLAPFPAKESLPFYTGRMTVQDDYRGGAGPMMRPH